MTYEPQYFILTADNKSKAVKDIANVSLYEACKDLLSHPKAGEDFTSIKRNGRHVAFYCNWRNTVVAMFGANEQERNVINAWFGEAS